MRIIIATSGSGGHLFCGLSIAEALKKRVPDVNLFFLGSGNKLSRKFIEDSGFRFFKIYATGLHGKGFIKIIKFIISQVIGIIQSGLLYLYIKPQVVFSAGGFASMGIVFWSWIFPPWRTPCIIHEQNIMPGKANRLSAYLADEILISFEGTRDYFRKRPLTLALSPHGRGKVEGGKRCILTGMPVRFKQKIPEKEARQILGLEPKRFTLLVMGGSRGAHRINQIIVDALKELPKDLQFIHLTGAEDLSFVKEAYKKNGLCAYVEDFSTKMDIIYSASSLVIGRAGSGMLSEITFFGLPSILIPYPYSMDRHQYKNAEYLAQKGAAVVMPEDNISIDNLIEIVKSRDRIHEMAKNSAGLANPGATEKIVDEIVEIANA